MNAVSSAFENNSTNVHANLWQDWLNRLRHDIWPSAVEHAVESFMTPDRSVTPPMLPEPAGGAVPLTVPGWPTHLNARVWGPAGLPAVLLVHGWSGQSADMHPFVEPLLAGGFRVVAFDAPAHGRSAGETTHLGDFARAIQVVARVTGPIHAAIGHSLGALALMVAKDQGVDLGRLVLVGMAGEPVDYALGLAARLGLSTDETADVLALLDRRLNAAIAGLSISGFTLGALAARQEGPALLLHADNDRVTPAADALRVAAVWDQAQVRLFRGLGHRRILADPQVIGAAMNFVQQDSTLPS